MIAQPGTDRVRHRNMRDQTRAKKTLLAGESTVDKLIDDDKGAGWQIFAQRAYRTNRNDVGDTQTLHRINVGAKVDIRRGNSVSSAVTR